MTTQLPSPLATWIPDPDILNHIGTALLDMAVDSLDAFGYAADYDRRLVTHGLVVVPEPNANQILVTSSRLFVGRPGQEEFQVPAGSPGKYGFQTVAFQIELWRNWPVRQRQQPISVGSIAAARSPLWRDAIIVYSAGLALVLGALVTDPKIPADNVHLGAMTPKGPTGGLAGYAIEVDVTL